MAEHIFTYIDPPNQKHIEHACKILEKGGVIAYPSDTNWAFACDATSTKGINKIKLLKSSEAEKQLFSILCESISMAAKIGVINQPTFRILRKILPGPYTIILRSMKSLPKVINDKRKTVGIKIPNSPLIIAIIESYGKPLVSASIPPIPDPENKTAAIEPKLGYQVEQHFGHGLDLILDLGEELSGLESTVVDFTEDTPIVIREGEGSVELFDEM